MLKPEEMNDIALCGYACCTFFPLNLYAWYYMQRLLFAHSSKLPKCKLLKTKKNSVHRIKIQ